MDSTHRRLANIASHLSGKEEDGRITMQQLPTAAISKGLGLEGHVVIITGSGQGIGEHAARHFAREGALVVVSDLDAMKSQRVSSEINNSGGKSISVPGDVTDPNYAENVVQATIKAFGKINVIVNNAGFTWDGMAHKMSDKQWDMMLSVHQTAPFRIIRAAAPYMREAGKKEIEKNGEAENRCIINISSTSGIHGNLGQVNYSTAKMGVLGMSMTIAKEWGPFGVRCNSIAYGSIDTRLTQAKEKGQTIKVDGKEIALGIPNGGLGDKTNKQVPLNRLGRADEAAAAIVLLASPLSSYITGHCLEVTGGFGI